MYCLYVEMLSAITKVSVVVPASRLMRTDQSRSARFLFMKLNRRGSIMFHFRLPGGGLADGERQADAVSRRVW